MSLRPTLRASRRAHWRRPGGPWDGPTIDGLLSHHDDGATAAQVASLAGALRARGVRRRDAVAWQLPNSTEAALLYRACWRVGAVAAPVHHAAAARDVDRVLTTVEPVVVVEGEAMVRSMLDAGAAPVPASACAAQPADLAVVLSTAGSTGAPKAVLHTHRALSYKARLMVQVHQLTRRDAVLMPAPLAHVSGLLNGVLVPGAAGMRSVYMARWDPDRAVDLIADEQISFMIGPPTFFVTLMAARRFSPEKVASLRLVSSGGAGVTPAFVESASAALGCTVKRTYGSTEAPTMTTSHAGDPRDRARDTDGRLVGEAELRLGDRDELLVRGPELFAGYADAGETREAVARGGWFRTGDRATISDDGWLTIVGRLKDVIIRGGENIAAAEVEAVLEAHPAVRAAVAVGEPDERLGERVVAFVVASGPFDLAACRSWFESRGVTRFKTPERVVQLDALPLLGAGKPDRAALRSMAVDGRSTP